MQHWVWLIALLLSCNEAATLERSENDDATATDCVEDGATVPSDTTLHDAAAAEDVSPCVPTCPVTNCGADDGCDGTCPPCPATENCPACAFRLYLVEATEKIVTLAIDYDPPAGGALPTVADIQLRMSGHGSWLGATTGTAIADAEKGAATDPATGEAWQLHEDGALLRVVVLGTNKISTIGGGRWLTARVRLGGAFEPQTSPVVVRVVRDEPTFAPPSADTPLTDPEVIMPVAIWPGSSFDRRDR